MKKSKERVQDERNVQAKSGEHGEGHHHKESHSHEYGEDSHKHKVQSGEELHAHECEGHSHVGHSLAECHHKESHSHVGHHHAHTHVHTHAHTHAHHHHEHTHVHNTHEQGCACHHHHDDGCGCGHNHGAEAEVKDVVGLILAISIWVLAIILDKFTGLDEKYSVLMYIAAYMVSGYKVVWQALKNIVKGQVFDENFLMTIASIGAFFIGEYPEASAVMLFYNLGELIQDYAVRRSKKSISDLMDVRAEYAVVLRNGKEVKVDPSTVEVGETIIVKAGERVAIDGEIVEGLADIDTRALTGETIPRVVEKGNAVLAGTVDISGVLYIRTTKTAQDSTIAKILKLTDMATTKKAKSEKFISKFAKYYTPIVVGLALLIFLVPSGISGFAEYKTWLYRALTFLVTSCPCALVISIPLSFFAGIGGASKMGILVKGANYIDSASKADTVVLDKTGTLTKGSFTVKKIESEHMSEDEFKNLIVSVEAYSKHPIASTIQNTMKTKESLLLVKNVTEKAGRGLKALVDNKEVLVGNELLMKDYGIQAKDCEDYGTMVHVSVDGRYEGYVLLSDTLKEDAISAVEELYTMGVNHVVMLTGDEPRAAKQIAEELKLTDYKAGVLPDEKLHYVKELMEKNHKPVVFVGDGLNDAPVLALSDVGIAMGQIGTDAAIEAADVVLMNDNISGVGKFIKHSVRTMRIVRENIALVLLIKLAVLVLAGLGLVGMWAAIFADVGVAVLAVINSVRSGYIVRGKRYESFES